MQRNEPASMCCAMLGRLTGSLVTAMRLRAGRPRTSGTCMQPLAPPSSPLQRFTTHWREIYQSDDPWAALAPFEGTLPPELLRQMDRRLFPGPFYGLWSDDLSQDGVLLLINPGAGPE